MVDNTVDPGDDMCGSPSCTLREAITAANNNPGVDTIIFNIPDAGVQTITPTSPLPTITETVTIDGYTQPGASANTLTVGDDAVILIELNGATAGNIGLSLGSDCTIRGLVINRFFFGIELAGSNNVVEGNFIGTDPSATTALGNGDGVEINGGDDNLVGGTAPSARNLISGNTGGGLVMVVNSAGNLVQGNFIGTDVTGTAALENLDGIVSRQILTRIPSGASSPERAISSRATVRPGSGSTAFERPDDWRSTQRPRSKIQVSRLTTTWSQPFSPSSPPAVTPPS